MAASGSARSATQRSSLATRDQHLAALADHLQIGLDVLLEEVGRHPDRGRGLGAGQRQPGRCVQLRGEEVGEDGKLVGGHTASSAGPVTPGR